MSLKFTNLFYLLHKAHCANGCLISYPIFNLVLLLNKWPGQAAGFHLKCHCWRPQLTSWAGLKVAIPNTAVLLKWDPILLSLAVTRVIITITVSFTPRRTTGHHCRLEGSISMFTVSIPRIGLVAVVQEEKNHLESQLLPSCEPSVMGKITSSITREDSNLVEWFQNSFYDL